MYKVLTFFFQFILKDGQNLSCSQKAYIKLNENGISLYIYMFTFGIESFLCNHLSFPHMCATATGGARNSVY